MIDAVSLRVNERKMVDFGIIGDALALSLNPDIVVVSTVGGDVYFSGVSAGDAVVHISAIDGDSPADIRVMVQ